MKSHRCNKSKWIYRSNSILTFLNVNLFIKCCIKHIESTESVSSTLRNKKRIFMLFVRVFCDENTTLHETHFEQWVRIDSIISKIEDLRIWRIYNLLKRHTTDLTSMRYVWRIRNKSQHAMSSRSNKKSSHNFIHSLSKDD